MSKRQRGDTPVQRGKDQFAIPAALGAAIKRAFQRGPAQPAQPRVDPEAARVRRAEQAMAGLDNAIEQRGEVGPKHRRDAQGRLIAPKPLVPRWMLGAALAGVLLVLVVVFVLGRATGGGASSAAPATQAPAAAPPAPVLAPTEQQQPTSTSGITGTGSVLLTGDMHLGIQLVGAQQIIEISTAMADGPYVIGDKTIGTVSSDGGGKRLTFNGTQAVAIYLHKVDPSLPPVTFTMLAGEKTRTFTLLAQIDGKFHLAVDGKDYGAFSPPESVDIGATRITTTDAGDSISFTFPAAQ